MMDTMLVCEALLLCILSLSIPARTANETAPHNLTFMMIASFGEFGFNSSGAVPAADVALDDINRNSSVLPGYRLGYDKTRNSKVGHIIVLHVSE